ncbi:LacI family DNA-binding transcriptional regulator [Butyrivibrio sp. LC3010]
MASIKDVAKLAHVGPATVLRVLNNSGYVSEDHPHLTMLPVSLKEGGSV